ncbi:MAG: polysaccharide deacetylase family protein [Planctomycetes bacterium]|nr:polysaccharide deacetylase family protein [Planctomycetota bacterium]
MYKVAQCWDDGVANDVIVAETCRKYGAKATFNINPATNKKDVRYANWKYQDFEVVKLSLAEMPSVYAGLTVASHTMTHPHPTAISLEEFRREAVDARKYIEDVWQREAPGFAWPYGENTPELRQVLRDAGFAYGRTCHNVEAVIPCADPMALHSNCHFLNPDFYAIWEKAKATGNFYFWGHSYEMKDDPALKAKYEKIVADISADPEAVWVDVVDLVR